MCPRLALIVLAGAIPSPGQHSNDPTPLQLSLPGKAFAVQVDASGFKVDQNVIRPNGSRYLMATNAANGMVLSMTLEKVTGEARIEDCRTVFRARIKSNAKLKPVDIKESQVGDMALLEFVIPAVSAVTINQKNVFGCIAKEDVYADLHFSKTDFKPQDQALFDSLLSAIRIVGKDAAAEARK